MAPLEVPGQECEQYRQLDAFFQLAKAKDECEYVWSLLRVRGEEDAGWDPLWESHRAIQDFIGLINAPLREITRLRLGLLTYCHITEIDAVYELTANLLRVIEGERYSMIPFVDYSSRTGKRTEYPTERIAALKDMEIALGLNTVTPMFDAFFDNNIRTPSTTPTTRFTRTNSVTERRGLVPLYPSKRSREGSRQPQLSIRPSLSCTRIIWLATKSRRSSEEGAPLDKISPYLCMRVAGSKA